MFCLAAAVCLCRGAGAAGPEVTPAQVEAMLASLHPDYALYISGVRYGATRLHPAALYAGLVRAGGRDPRMPEDGPRTGHGVRNELVIYADMFEPWRTPGWRLLITDHEYFHARHLARGFDIPVAGFDQMKTDTDYREALAWAWVARREADNVYGPLSAAERAEVAARYREHYDGFLAFVNRRQPSAWAHYGRFLPDPDSLVRRAAAAPIAETPPPADGATR